MTLGIMQPYFFPYLGYFQHINACDEFVLLDDVNFIKKGYIHRNEILQNGQRLRINIPLIKASQNKEIRKLKIDKENIDFKKLKGKVSIAYSKTPYFKEIFPVVEACLDCEDDDLSTFLYKSISLVCRLIDIDTLVYPTSSIFPKGSFKGQERILKITQTLKADTYINPIGGRELYQVEHFHNIGANLLFHRINGDITYPQNTEKFESNLSILDVLFNVGPRRTKELLNEFELLEPNAV